VTLKAQLVMFYCKKNLFVQFVVHPCQFYIFNHVKTGGLLRLKSHNFVIFQDNLTIFGTYMSVWTENVIAEFHQKNLNSFLKIWKIRQGITFFCRTL